MGSHVNIITYLVINCCLVIIFCDVGYKRPARKVIRSRNIKYDNMHNNQYSRVVKYHNMTLPRVSTSRLRTLVKKKIKKIIKTKSDKFAAAGGSKYLHKNVTNLDKTNNYNKLNR